MKKLYGRTYIVFKKITREQIGILSDIDWKYMKLDYSLPRKPQFSGILKSWSYWTHGGGKYPYLIFIKKRQLQMSKEENAYFSQESR